MASVASHIAINVELVFWKPAKLHREPWGRFRRIAGERNDHHEGYMAE